MGEEQEQRESEERGVGAGQGGEAGEGQGGEVGAGQGGGKILAPGHLHILDKVP